jgi:hypothetical protein
VGFGGWEYLAKYKPYFWGLIFAALFLVAYYFWSLFFAAKNKSFLIFSFFYYWRLFPHY